MQLKRYVLLEDNKIYDLHNKDDFSSFWTKDYKLVATCDEVTDLIRKGDLISNNSAFCKLAKSYTIL